ncbi:MAG TPA: xanthine dehydrogenase family protein molybdopterin-binding subunit, partial [Ramlibacter sp.]|nr:xanthine dehydrogenase family protein molybdopterin-binding subunit [Ramlibacter sp.]
TVPSAYAHARILAVRCDAARALPGVIAVVTGAEAAAVSGPLPTRANPTVTQRCLAVDKVRYVGEPVVAIVAETRAIAEDAAALVEIDYEELPVVADMDAALAARGDAVLHPERGDSNVYTIVHRQWGEVDAAFANAAHVVRKVFRWPRVSAQPIETVGAVVDYEPVTQHFFFYSNMSQQMIASGGLAAALKVRPSQLSFTPMYVGGSFGGKVGVYHVAILAAVLARICCRPVKFIEDRLEHLLNGNQHGSDRRYLAELAVDADGVFTGLRCDVVDDYGAYFHLALGAHGNAVAQITGPYRMTAVDYKVTAVATNKTQQGPYRGFGGEVANFVLERLVDAAARELRTDPIALRRKNFLRPEVFPYKTPTGNLYDSGNYEGVLDAALRMAGLDAWKERKAARRGGTKPLGIGIATVCERSVMNVTEFWFFEDKPLNPVSSSPESVSIRIDVQGVPIVTIYAPCWGNSPETLAAQLTAEHLCVDPSSIVVNYAGTDGGMLSKGPAGSRFTVMLAGAVEGACKALLAKLKAVAAHRWSCREADVAIDERGAIMLTGEGQVMTLAQIAEASYLYRLDFPQGDRFTTGLAASFTYDHPCATLPDPATGDLGIFYPIVGHACHLVLVEVDTELATVRILDYVAVHDVGQVVNPMTMDGQIRGGIAQGIGTVLLEKYEFDENGQALTGSLADYLLPTACEVPDIRVSHFTTPSPLTSLGIKGGGEGGRLAACPAITSAIDDALEEQGIFITELPVTPTRLFNLLREAGKPAAANSL